MAYGLFLVIFSYPSARTRPYAGDGGSTTQGHNQFNPQESLNFVKIVFIIVVFFSRSVEQDPTILCNVGIWNDGRAGLHVSPEHVGDTSVDCFGQRVVKKINHRRLVKSFRKTASRVNNN